MDARPDPRAAGSTGRSGSDRGQSRRKPPAGRAAPPARSSGSSRNGERPASRPPARRPPARAKTDWRPDWLKAFGRRLASLAVSPATRVGLVGVALVFVGLSANLMARTPSYYNLDETAHVGYLSSLAQGHFPEIETPIEVKNPDDGLASRLEDAPRDQKTVWVANHPPGAYLPAVPLAWATNALGFEAALPVVLRLTGIVTGLFAVGFAYLLGRELSNGDERAGLLTAALTVFVPTFPFMSGSGMTDAASFAAGLAVTWMAVRMIRLGYTSHRTYWLAAFVALSAFTRLTAFAIAVATVLALTAFAKEHRLRFLATALLPATALAGWFYFRIQRLYGDVAASDYLLTRMDERRGVRSSFTGALFDGSRWDDVLRGLAMSAPPYRFMFGYLWFRLLKVAVIGSVVAVLVTPLVRYLRDSPRPPLSWKRLDDRGTGRVGWCAAIVLVITVALPFLFMAQHLAGGGGRHSRYLLPAVPVIAAIIARGTWMLADEISRWVQLAIVALGAVSSFFLVRFLKLPQFYPVVDPLWIKTLLPGTVAGFAAALAIVGFAALFWSFSVDSQARLIPQASPAARPRPSNRSAKPARPANPRPRTPSTDRR